MSIRFGTSGWRAVIADEFTFENVRSATEAICSYLKGSHSGSSRQTLIIGHDTRFMGEKFMATAAEIARKKGFRVLQCEEAVPTPALSHAIRQERAAGGIARSLLSPETVLCSFQSLLLAVVVVPALRVLQG